MQGSIHVNFHCLLIDPSSFLLYCGIYIYILKTKKRLKVS